MRLKKYKAFKILLLKIFISQQKNNLQLTIKLKSGDLMLLFFLWSLGYIIGFTRVNFNFYTIFFKKQFKQFSVRFFETKVCSKTLFFYNHTSTIKTQVILSSKGLKTNSLYAQNIGGFLLCDIF